MSKLKTYKFSDLYTMSSGISSKPEQAGHGSPFVSFKTVFNNYFLPDILEDLMDISEKDKYIYSVKKGDIFLTRTSETLNELGMSSVAIKNYPNSSFSGFLKRLRRNQSDITYDKFMAFYLRSDLFRKTMTNNSIMTLRASLNEQIFSYLELVLPDYKEQKKAGDFLYAINKKIDINNKINDELQAITKAIYDYWFIQFDFPNEEGKPFKSNGGEMVFNKVLKKSIPFGWEIKEFSEVCNIYQSQTITGKQMDNNGKYLVYGSNGIIGRYNYYNHINSEIIVSCRGNCGNILRTRPNSWITGNAMVFKLFDSEIHNEFLYQTLKWTNIKQVVTGSVQGQLTRSNVSSLKILMPNKDVLKGFSESISTIIDRRLILLKENDELLELRDWLLPMLMNGQVTVNSDTNIRKDEVLAMVAEPSTVYEKTVKVVLENVATKKSKREKTPVVILNNVDVYKRTLLAAEIVFQYKNEYTLGHLKLQKMLYLCKESESMNLPMNFLKQAMGPYDNQLARSLDKQFEEKKWFKYQNGDGLKYIPMENCGKHSEDFKKYFEDQLPTIHSLITTFKKFKSQDIEAVATLFACWKDAILNNELTNDIIIIKKFYEWSDEKIKFKEADLKKHLNWMRVNSIYPIINK